MKDSNDFGKNINELLSLLKKILKSQKTDNPDFSSLLDKKNINLNLCFFTFLPLSDEELEEFEYELEEYFLDEEPNIGKDLKKDLKFEITRNDLDFLKQHGLKF